MSEAKLFCGCGGEIESHKLLSSDDYWLRCHRCGITTEECPTEAEAIAAFKKATRADIKQGIQWIPVMERLPTLADGKLVVDGTIDVLIIEEGLVSVGNFYPKLQVWNFGADPAYWAKIDNLPEKIK
jgi:ferredoxin